MFILDTHVSYAPANQIFPSFGPTKLLDRFLRRLNNNLIVYFLFLKELTRHKRAQEWFEMQSRMQELLLLLFLSFSTLLFRIPAKKHQWSYGQNAVYHQHNPMRQQIFFGHCDKRTNKEWSLRVGSIGSCKAGGDGVVQGGEFCGPHIFRIFLLFGKISRRCCEVAVRQIEGKTTRAHKSQWHAPLLLPSNYNK